MSKLRARVCNRDGPRLHSACCSASAAKPAVGRQIRPKTKRSVLALRKLRLQGEDGVPQSGLWVDGVDCAPHIHNMRPLIGCKGLHCLQVNLADA